MEMKTKVERRFRRPKAMSVMDSKTMMKSRRSSGR
jgi:hypothetical protein